MDARDIPVPYEHQHASFYDAVRDVIDLSKGAPTWVKMFHARDESDVRLRWTPAEGFHEASPTAADYVYGAQATG
jgi:hypothetical protein